jgi:hypothetical protein
MQQALGTVAESILGGGGVKEMEEGSEERCCGDGVQHRRPIFGLLIYWFEKRRW